MRDTNDQYDLRSFANEQGDVRSVANEQPGQSIANEQSGQPAVVSAKHGRNDQSGRKYLKLVHSRRDHKTCISKHRDRIKSIRSSFPVTDLAGLRVFQVFTSRRSTRSEQECSNFRRELRARKQDSNEPIRQQEILCKHASQCCVELPNFENRRWNTPRKLLESFRENVTALEVEGCKSRD